MKQFLRKLLCFSLVLFLLLSGLGALYHRASPIAQEFQHPLEEMPEQIRLAVVGSSHGLFGMELSPYSDSYFNFSMAGQTPQYDYAMLKEFEDRIADGATVLLTVSYISPFWSDPPNRFLEKQTRYYRTLSKENIVDYDWADAFRVRLNTLFPPSRILFTDFSDLIQTLKAYRHRPKSQPVPEPAAAASAQPAVDAVTDATTEATPAAEDPSRDPNAVCKGYVDPKGINHNCWYIPPSWFDDLEHYRSLIQREHFSIVDPFYPDMNPDMQAAYEGICQLAEKHNWRLIAVTTPYTRPYNDMFDQEFYDVFYQHLDTLFSPYDVEYWDYSHDPRFVDCPDYFEDLDHLIFEGQELFGSILARRLGLIS